MINNHNGALSNSPVKVPVLTQTWCEQGLSCSFNGIEICVCRASLEKEEKRADPVCIDTHSFFFADQHGLQMKTLGAPF